MAEIRERAGKAPVTGAGSMGKKIKAVKESKSAGLKPKAKSLIGSGLELLPSWKLESIKNLLNYCYHSYLSPAFVKKLVLSVQPLAGTSGGMQVLLWLSRRLPKHSVLTF